MERTDLSIIIDGEETRSSSSCAHMLGETNNTAFQFDMFRELREAGVSILAIMALAYTVPTDELIFKIKSTPSAIIEETQPETLNQIYSDAAGEKMSDDDFRKVMIALEEIWSACPDDLPGDLSTRHDQYLSGAKG